LAGGWGVEWPSPSSGQGLVVGCGECCDDLPGSGAMELVWQV
jgi:hypothetical protein